MQVRWKIGRSPRGSRRNLLGSTALIPGALIPGALIPGALIPGALALFGAGPAWGQAVNMGASAGNVIIPDGRTATRVTSAGRSTNITTSTMSGGNAFNSFSQFKAGAGNTVNLQVPKNAKTLVNIVRDGPVDIQGTLNSYQDGRIGGDVVFSDSYGFVVGKGGVVNTGGLTVVTPRQGVNDALIDASGNIDSALANRVIHGNVPLSADGSVMIAGRINAQHGVRIRAQDVVVAGSYDGAARMARHRALFESTVNAGGLVEGGAIVVRNGSIRIVAAGTVDVQAGAAVGAGARTRAGTAARGPQVLVRAKTDVTLAGTVVARAATDGPAGRVSVRSGHDIAVASTAVVSAPGAGTTSGGDVKLYADHNLSVADGAAFLAAASGTGDGGEVELSAANRESLGRIDLDLSAPHGPVGTLLLDPANIVVLSAAELQPADTADTTYFKTGDVVTTTGGAYRVDLEASNSIRVDQSAVIDSRAATGAADIILSAPSISVLGGAQLLAQPTTGTAGKVTLTATATTQNPTASITIGDASGAASVITGGDIVIAAGAALAGSPAATAAIAFDNARVDASGSLSAVASAAGGTQAATSFLPAVATGTVSASVTVTGNATLLTSGGALTLESDAVTLVSAAATAPGTQAGAAPAAAAVALANTTSTAQTVVGGGGAADAPVVKAGGALSIAANNTVGSSAVADASQAAFAGAGVAANIVSVTTTASVAGAAQVSAGAALAVAANTATALVTTSTASAQGAPSTVDGTSTLGGLLSSPKFAKYLDTVNGSVSATGVFSAADLTSNTSASMASTAAVPVAGRTAGGPLSVTATAQNASAVTADASNVDATKAGLNIGAAVALNIAPSVTDAATLSQNVSAVGVTVSALDAAPAAGTVPAGFGATGVTVADPNGFATAATAGSGSAAVAVAGALATGVLSASNTAVVAPGITVDAGGGAVQVSSGNLASSTVSALPQAASGAVGSKVGAGASLALNLVSTDSEADLSLPGAANLTLNNAGDVTVSARAAHVASTSASAGAGGGIAATPVAAVTLADDRTTAQIGAIQGGSLSAAGNVSV